MTQPSHFSSVVCDPAPELHIEDFDDDMVHEVIDEETGMTLCGLRLGPDWEDCGDDAGIDCVVCAEMVMAGV